MRPVRRLLFNVVAVLSVVPCGCCLWAAAAMLDGHDLIDIQTPLGDYVPADAATPFHIACAAAAAFAVLPVAAVAGVVRRSAQRRAARRRAAAVTCVACGYDLRASPDR